MSFDNESSNRDNDAALDAAENDALEADRERDDEQCEHGLSAWLCAGPMHYPDDRW